MKERMFLQEISILLLLLKTGLLCLEEDVRILGFAELIISCTTLSSLYCTRLHIMSFYHHCITQASVLLSFEVLFVCNNFVPFLCGTRQLLEVVLIMHISVV